MKPNVLRRKRKKNDGPMLDYTNLRNTFKNLDLPKKKRPPTSVPVSVNLEKQIRKAQKKFIEIGQTMPQRGPVKLGSNNIKRDTIIFALIIILPLLLLIISGIYWTRRNLNMAEPSIKEALENWTSAVKARPEDRFKIINIDGFGNVKLDLSTLKIEDATIEDNSMLVTVDIKFKV